MVCSSSNKIGKRKVEDTMSRLKGLLALLIAVTLVFSTGVVAFAATTEEKEAAVKEYIKEKVTAKDDGSLSFGDASLRTEISTTAPSDNPKSVILADGQTTVYYSADSLDVLYTKVSKASEAAAINDKVNQMTDGFKVDADISGATTMMKGFQPIIQLLTGLICYAAVIFMGLFSAFDICYIAFPVFRDKCEDAKANGTGAMVKTSSNGTKSLRFVTDEAQFAVKESQLNETGKSPWGIYLKKRALAYILMAIVIYILFTGNIALIVNIALNMVDGIMEALGTLAG